MTFLKTTLTAAALLLAAGTASAANRCTPVSAVVLVAADAAIQDDLTPEQRAFVVAENAKLAAAMNVPLMAMAVIGMDGQIRTARPYDITTNFRWLDAMLAPARAAKTMPKEGMVEQITAALPSLALAAEAGGVQKAELIAMTNRWQELATKVGPVEAARVLSYELRMDYLNGKMAEIATLQAKGPIGYTFSWWNGHEFYPASDCTRTDYPKPAVVVEIQDAAHGMGVDLNDFFPNGLK